MSEPGMVIIGAGECGVRAAFALREAGYAGFINLVGEENSLPYERPPLSKGSDVEPKLIAEQSRYVEANIALRTGLRITSIDRVAKQVSASDGTSIAYQRLLLATGARPRPFPGVEQDGKRILSLRDHNDAKALRAWMIPGRKVAIVGGGFIGLELAATFRGVGTEVTVIEAQSRILMRGVHELLAARIHERHLTEGVELRCGSGIARIDSHLDGVLITLQDGSAISADVAIIGIGAIPNSALAEATGLAVDNGIVVDERLQTSDPDIFAAGDCCNFPFAGRRVRLESWRSAQEQGSRAARNMLGLEELADNVPWFWSDQYDLTLQVTGLADGSIETVERKLDETSSILFHLGKDGILLSASGLGPGNAVARDIRLAEMLIAAGRRLDVALLGDPSVKLKSLLKSA